MNHAKKTPPTPMREMVVRAPERLAELYEHAGYHVRLLVSRLDGRELSAHNQSVIPAFVAGYEADEHRPEVTAADVNLLEELPKLESKERAETQAKTKKKTTTAKTAPAKSTAAKKTPRKKKAPER